jgi:type I restriction enzyme S subunit
MVKLGVCLQRRKDTVMPATLSDASVGLVGLEDIQDGGRGGITIRETKPQDIESLKTRFVAGDILYGKLRPNLNKVGIVARAGLCSTEIWAFGPSPLVNSRFAVFFLASSYFVERVVSLTKGANLPRLDTEAFDSIEIPLPPPSEQQRIVEILQEADQIRRLRAEGEAKTAELIPAMFFDHFVIGPNHDFLPLHKLAEVVSGVAIGRKTKGMTVEVPYLRVANVQAGFVDLSEIKTTTATDEEVLHFALKSGDVLLTEGGDFDKLGRGCLWDGQVDPCIHQNHVFRVRPFSEKLNSRFFAHYLQSAKAKHYFLRCAKKTTNLASINLTQLKALPVPNVSLDDQERFEQQIQIAAECSSKGGTTAFNALARSLSAHAFSGQLTEEWREAHKEQLAREARERDEALKTASKKAGRIPRLSGTATLGFSFTVDVSVERRSGIYSDLNREQRDLLAQISAWVKAKKKSVEQGDHRVWYFSAHSLSESLEGSLRRHLQAIEGHLAVFATRGIVIPVSREEQTEDTGEFVFGNAYRLPVENMKQFLTDDDGNQLVTEAGDILVTEQEIRDHCRLSELERLATRLEKERALT